MPYGLQSSLSILNSINFESANVIQVPYTITYKTIKTFNNKESDINVAPNLVKSNLHTNTSDAYQSSIYLQLISCLWLMVVIIIASYTIVMTMKLKAKFKKGHVCNNEVVMLLLLQCKNKLNIKSNIKIINTNEIKTPQVYGMSYIINDKSQIKRRITMISLFKKNSYKWSIIPIVTLTLLGGVMLTNAKNKPVLADNKNNQSIQSKTSSITEVAIIGENFKGTMIMIPNDKKIVVGFNKDILKITKTTSQIAKESNVIAAINYGGFSGVTLSPLGLIMHDGKIIFNDLKDNTSKIDIVAFTNKGKLLVGRYSLNELNKLNTTEAVSFGPALIVNGKPTITKDDGGWGLAPRTAIGQKKDGTILMLTIDGRNAKSKGATLLDVQNILLQYGAVNASNLDGGSSSTMYYNGKVINNPCGEVIKSGEVMINDPDSKRGCKLFCVFSFFKQNN